MKVIFFGDSLTWGGYGGDYVAEIRQRVADKHDIINAGVGGNTVLNLHRRLESDVLAHEPDAVFIMVGGNDAVAFSQPDTRPYYRKSMGLEEGFLSETEFVQHYRDMLMQLQAHFIQVYIGLPPIESNPTVAAAQRKFNALTEEAAHAYNIPILDLYAHFMPAQVPQRPPVNTRFIQQIADRERSGWNQWEQAQAEHGYAFSFDGVHWTPQTAQDAAKRIIAFMGL